MDHLSTSPPDIKILREAIPTRCFERSLPRSLSYVLRDLVLMVLLFSVAFYIMQTTDQTLRTVLWMLYGFTQGLVFVGIWILAHECGHDAFSPFQKVNSSVGFVLHSIVLVPFFSWKYSHARHHRYANHMEKDTVFVPTRKEEHWSTTFPESFLKHAEDAPILGVLLLVGHQLVGWPSYVVLNSSAGARSLVQSNRKSSWRQSHLDPAGHLFTSSEHPYIWLSNIGLFVTALALWKTSTVIGLCNTFLIYGVPYLWMNHWIIAITYLHHTHHDAPHYEENAWTFQKGALSTIDRDMGFIGRHLFHGIVEFHIVHHLFSRIPFYHAEEATAAIAPLLGKSYIQKKTSFHYELWQTFRSCKYVESGHAATGVLHWGGNDHQD